MAFVFAAVWAFGGALCEKDGVKYRQQFDKWWKVSTTGSVVGHQRQRGGIEELRNSRPFGCSSRGLEL